MKYLHKTIIFITILFLLAGCSIKHENKLKDQTTTQIANPASVNCQENNGTLEIRTNQDGSQYGVCIFSDGSECEEWAYFNGKCSPGVKK